MKRKTIYYKDEASDDFSGVSRNTIKIDDKYKYLRNNFFWKISAFVVYRIIVIPFAYIYMKIKFRHKCVNKKVLKQCKKQGCFIYGNHTLMAGDAFIPNIINSPRKTYTIVHPDNVSVKITRPFVEMLGALPLPDTIVATRNFIDAINKRIEQKCVIQIYPEAHIWPYYTNIRPFGSASFKYPIKLNAPTFTITNTFHKRKFSKTPKIISYIDGPFFVDKNLPQKVQEQTLRDMVYSTMCERAKNNTYNFYEYKKEESSID